MIGSRFIKRLRASENGATLVEFAIISPALMVLVMGIFDVGHTQYTNALVNGALQKAGRDLTLEGAGGNEAAIDQKVIDQIKNVTPSSAQIELIKLSNFDFSDIGEPEDFTDENGDGICNNNEVFADANENGQWDADRGKDGIGGARDAVMVTARVSYDRFFPMAGLAGLPEQVVLTSSTVLRNQPYDEQDRNIETGNCT